jgi:uncharacterized protein (TIGR02117 family)
MNREPCLKACRYGVLSLAFILLTLLLGSLLPTKWHYHAELDCTYPIYVSSVNHFHAELVVPVTAAAFDWRSHLTLSQLGPNADTYRYLSFGWGDRKFFMNSSYDPLTLFDTLFLPGPTVMHVWGHQDLKNLHSKDVEIKQIRLNRSNYLALMNFIDAGFQHDDAHHTVYYLRQGLYPESGFYEAVGRYSILRTCNTWTAEGLRIADVNTPVWSALAPPILYQLKSDCGVSSGKLSLPIVQRSNYKTATTTDLTLQLPSRNKSFNFCSNRWA